MRGYLNKLEKTKETIDNEGWIHSGDIGRIDEVKERWREGGREGEQERKGYILYKMIYWQE